MRKRVIACLGLLCLIIVQLPVFGFTQGIEFIDSLMPVGHEWITRQAAIEVLGGERYVPHDPDDPRRNWPPEARAANTSLAGAEAEAARIRRDTVEDPRAAATYKAVADAIIGERWVDIAGVNVVQARIDAKFGGIDCFDSAAQEPPDIQYDHFMRRPDDADAVGGFHAAKASADRFVKYFVAAANAPDGEMQVWDGGSFAAPATVDRHYFLFGRALHVFQDSFSPDHTVRVWDPAKGDYYRQVHQVKSYLCAAGSQQHAHLEPPAAAFYQTGDVIWISESGTGLPGDWRAYMPHNIRSYGLSAIEGSKDVWAAFIRTMAKPRSERSQHALKEANTLTERWLRFEREDMLTWYRDPAHRDATYVKSNNRQDDGGNGTTQQQCMNRDWNGVTVAYKLEELKEKRRKCLYNMIPNWGEQKDFDHSLHLAYDWNWRAGATKPLETPPDGWQITQNDDVVPLQIRLINRANGQYMRREGTYVYNDKPDTPQKRKDILTFAVPWHVNQPGTQRVTLPVVGMSDRFLNRAGGVYGLIGLYSTPDKGHYSFERRTDGYYNIRNVDDQLYVYMDENGKDYINKSGDPQTRYGQWRVEGLPEPHPANGTYGIDTMGGYPVTIGNGQVVIDTRGLTNHVALERQADGSYKLKLSGSYVRLDPGTHRLLTDPTGTTFQVQQHQSRDQYTIRSSDGTYWKATGPNAGDPVLSDATTHQATIFVLSRQWD